MYKKIENAILGFGQIGEDKVIAGINEFDYEDNKLIKKLSFPVYEDEERGVKLYMYKDCLYTYKELHKAYLKEYYNVK